MIEKVLAECGDDIDAAIARLGGLRLCASAAAGGEAVGASRAQGGPAGAEPGSLAGGEAPAAAGSPTSAEGWVDSLVQEMLAAKDVADAKARAAKFLRAFEASTMERARANGEGEGTGTAGHRGEDLAKENAILKRAVQIQSARLAEQGDKDKDIIKLREALAQYEQEIRTLQMSNYSLSVHLKQAQETGSVVDKNHNPDVY